MPKSAKIIFRKERQKVNFAPAKGEAYSILYVLQVTVVCSVLYHINVISKHFPFFFYGENMSILDKITDDNIWQEYLNYKKEKAHLTKKDEAFLTDFIEGKKYKDTVAKLKSNDFEFSLPTKKLINKSGSTKKRTIYKFPEAESMVLKIISYCLYTYDYKMSDNCFSFRKSFGVKRAVETIVNRKNIENMYCYKLDISNYFNSINIDKLMPILKDFLHDDPKLVAFFDKFLHVDKAIFDGEIIKEKRGAMAGTSLSTFFANVYLRDLDLYFYSQNIPYARYSDDVIVFAETKEKLEEYRRYINKTIKEIGRAHV